jgi:hypothetical protein
VLRCETLSWSERGPGGAASQLPVREQEKAQADQKQSQRREPALLAEVGSLARCDRQSVEDRVGHVGQCLNPLVEESGHGADDDENTTHHDTGHKLVKTDHVE